MRISMRGPMSSVGDDGQRVRGGIVSMYSSSILASSIFQYCTRDFAIAYGRCYITMTDPKSPRSHRYRTQQANRDFRSSQIYNRKASSLHPFEVESTVCAVCVPCDHGPIEQNISCMVVLSVIVRLFADARRIVSVFVDVGGLLALRL